MLLKYILLEKINLHILLDLFLFKYPLMYIYLRHCLNIDTGKRARRRLENLLNGSVQRATSLATHPVFPSS